MSAARFRADLWFSMRTWIRGRVLDERTAPCFPAVAYWISVRRAYGYGHVQFISRVGVGPAGVLKSAVGMMHEAPGFGLAISDGHLGSLYGKGALRCVSNAHPTTLRLNASSTAARKANSSARCRNVMSVTHRWLTPLRIIPPGKVRHDLPTMPEVRRQRNKEPCTPAQQIVFMHDP